MKTFYLALCACALLNLNACADTDAGEHGSGNGSDPEVTVYRAVTPVSMESLLEEMISFEESVYWPVPSYTSKQASSTDRRSVAPDKPYWFGNQDNTRYVRIGNDNADRRVEKVLFEQSGPGAITRIWTAGNVTHATLRFYFDGERTARLTVKGNDLTQLPFYIPDGLVARHLHYDRHGGTSLHLPLPYRTGCKVTIDEADPDYGFAYHIGYRSYEAGTEVRTFTLEEAARLHAVMDRVAALLKSPPAYEGGLLCQHLESIEGGKSMSLALPDGPHAVRNLMIRVNGANSSRYAQLMRGLVVKITFDGTQTVWAPLSDFSGGGIGAFAVDSWYLSADGEGRCECRYVMPYRENASIEIENLTSQRAEVRIEARVSECTWHTNTCYFHCSWRQEGGLQTGSDYDSNDNHEWLFSDLAGRGIYKGDVLTLYNYRDTWYGEGDEKIYIDGESFPSHFGTGVEDYYNTSFAPVEVFHTPFGGAVRADNDSSLGYNTWLRSRNLDGITFGSSLRFDFELLGWARATVLFSSTVFWYGAPDAAALQTSGSSELTAPIPN